jgi:hypothetical protein
VSRDAIVCSHGNNNYESVAEMTTPYLYVTNKDLVFHGTTAYSMFKAEATNVPVSNQSNAGGTQRPSFRVPFRVQAGAAIAQGTGNADSMGRGTGSQWASFAIAPVYLFNVCEISWLAQASTDSRQKGLFAVKAQEMKNSLDSAMQGIEGLINSDGSGKQAICLTQ